MCDQATPTLSDLLDRCDTSHFGISYIAYYILKGRFCYIENWYEYDAYYNTWTKQREDYKLRIALSTDVSDAYRNRAVYWMNESVKTDVDEHYQEKYRDMQRVLIKISNSLKQYDFKSTIVRECRCLFWVHKLPVSCGAQVSDHDLTVELHDVELGA